MGFLKRLIALKGMVPEGYNYEMVLPGEPMIYSIKYRCGSRDLSGQQFRNRKFASMIKCHFTRARNRKEPYVILVRFFCTPLRPGLATLEELKAENKPAVASFEICEYLLSFQEMLFNVLYDYYKQIVKIDAEKFYSLNPRTTFKFMKWEHYEHFRNQGTVSPKGKGKRQTSPMGSVQSECEGDEPTAPVYPIQYDSNGTSYKVPPSRLSLPDADPSKVQKPKKTRVNRNKSCKKT